MTIDICFASDDAYAPFMGVALESVLAHASRQDLIRFHVLDNGISALNKRRITALRGRHPAFSVTYYPVDAALLEGLPLVNSHLSRTAYARLFMGCILPDFVQRVIYLDCDVVVRSSLAELARIQLDGQLVGGVEDLGVMKKARAGRHPWPYRKQTYINSGVLLIDLARWRAEDVAGQLIRYMRAPAHPLQYEDQDVLNFALSGRVKILPPCWNGQMYWGSSMWNRHPEIALLRRTLLTCPVVHFASPAKPWFEKSGWHQNTKQYRRMMACSPWAECVRPIGGVEVWRRLWHYVKIHPLCWLKPGFYQNLYWEGVCALR